MGHARDDVDHVGVPGKNRWQRPDDILNSLVWRQQSEGEQNGLAFGAKPVFEVVGVHELHIRHTVRDNIDFPARHRVHIAKHVGGHLGHDNEPVGSLRDFLEHTSLRGAGLPENSVQRSYQGHLQPAQQGKYVVAVSAPVDAIFVLQAYQVVAIEVQKIGGAIIGRDIFLIEFQTHSLWIFVARLRIVDRDCKEAVCSIFRRHGRAQVGRECGDAALAGQMISNKGDTSWQRQSAGLQIGFLRTIRSVFEANDVH